MAIGESAGSILAAMAAQASAQNTNIPQLAPPWQPQLAQVGNMPPWHEQNPNPAPTPPSLAARAREMFLKRMGGIRAEMKVQPTDFLQCHVTQDMVFVFFCFSGKEGVVKEPIDMFPSDPLIAQFRMILI